MTRPVSCCALLLLACYLSLAGSGAAPASAAQGLTVHEWGTFTALQDDDGTALSGINVDDEPLPPFVHNLSQHVLTRATGLQNIYMKGVPQRHPYVTLRLETPVVYFYPPPGRAKPITLDVDVTFHGGWLTQFYPQAEAGAPGLKEGKFHFGTIDSQTRSTLSWRGLSVGTRAEEPKTDAPVWLAPRQVRAAMVTAESGQSERYLFYRGVGNFAAPLQVASDLAADKIEVRLPPAEAAAAAAPALEPGPLWLVEVRADGKAAFRTLKAAPRSESVNRRVVAARRSFTAGDFAAGNIDQLSRSMHAVLTAAGLFDDEAKAMLATWRQAYFASPGLRLFFVVPRRWTDAVLPLRISQPCMIERVMVARIELVSPAQRARIERLKNDTNPDIGWLEEARKSPNFGRLLAGRTPIGDLGVPVPEQFQAYLDLGRFRNALVIAEEKKRHTPALTAFINAYGLGAYFWPAETNANDE